MLLYLLFEDVLGAHEEDERKTAECCSDEPSKEARLARNAVIFLLPAVPLSHSPPRKRARRDKASVAWPVTRDHMLAPLKREHEGPRADASDQAPSASEGARWGGQNAWARLGGQCDTGNDTADGCDR